MVLPYAYFRTYHNQPGVPIVTLRGHGGSVKCVTVDATFLFSASFDRTIKKWNKTVSYGGHPICRSSLALIVQCKAQSGELISTLVGHTQGIKSLRQDERYLYSGAEDDTLRIWDKQVRNP
jgi:F-box/WD-40 domain protein MET30